MDAGTKAYIAKEESVRRVEDYFRALGINWYDQDPIGSLIESHHYLRSRNTMHVDSALRISNKLNSYRAFRWLPPFVKNKIWHFLAH